MKRVSRKGIFLLLAATFVVATSGLTINRTAADSNQLALKPKSQSSRERHIGRVPELARVSPYLGSVNADEKIQMMISFEVVNEGGLRGLIDELYDPESPRFHQWLTPEEFGERFGRSSEELDRAVEWLTSQGLTIEQAWPSRLAISFSGTVSAVERSFHVEMGRYYHAREDRVFYSNRQDPVLPQDIRDMTVSLLGLDDAYRAHTAMKQKDAGKLRISSGNLPGQQTSRVRIEGQLPGTSTFISPKDLALVYNIKPLADAGIRGQGQRVAIVIDSDVRDSDIASHRTAFNLPASNLQRVVPTGLSNPGIKPTTGSSYGEAILDIDSVSAVAPQAEIDLVLVPTLSTANIRTAEMYIINTLRTPVVNESFGGCESVFFDVSAQNSFLQAAVQGIAFFNSSGDEGVECFPDSSSHVSGHAEVGCPSCYEGVTSVGGTQIQAQFGANGDLVALTQESTWNDPPGERFDCSGNPLANGGGASGGGVSQRVNRPDYQTGATGFIGGVPAGSTRTVPDVAALAGLPGAPLFISGQLFLAGGTSQSSPLWAGMMALINQFKGSAQGSPNREFYRLGVNQYKNNGPAVFRDIVAGSNSTGPRQTCLPNGVNGFNAGFGYDAVTGWGVPNLDLLARNFGVSQGGGTEVELTVDDASFETAVGLTFGGTLSAVNRLTPPSYPAKLTGVKVYFRHEQFGGGVAMGDPVAILVAAHENGSDSIDLTQFQTLNTTIQTLGAFALFDVPDITINSGDFLVGFRITHPPGQFPIALDGTAPLRQRSYVSFNGTLFQHIENANLALIGNFGLRAEVTLTPVQTCTYGISPGSQSFTTSGGTGNIDVTTSAGNCSWSATTIANWITFTSSSGTGNGRVSFTVASNAGGPARSASINVANQVFTVSQAGIPQPVILNALVQKKQLLVSGQNFDAGARLFINGANTKKVFNDEANPSTLLVANKAGKDIASGQTVTLEVHNVSGAVSAVFRFTRP